MDGFYRRYTMVLSLGILLLAAQWFPISAKDGGEGVIQLLVGETKILDIHGLVKVAVGDPAIADLRVISEGELLINGKGEGSTSIVIWTEDHRISKAVEVRTGQSRDHMLAEEISQLIAEEGVKVRVIDGVVILDGEVADDVEVERAIKIADIYSPGGVINLLSPSSKPYQVEIEVRIAEVDKSFVEELGIRESEDILSVGIVEHISNIESSLLSLASEGRARLLAKPNLVTLSGHEASFLVGGEIPIPIKEDIGISVQWKEYGVRLTIKAEVEKRKDMKYVLCNVGTIVSTLDWANSVKIDGQTMPAIKMRNVDSTLQILDGDTLIIAGLIQNNESKYVSKIPILGDIPILGILFKSVEFNESQTELVIFITPSIVE